MLRAFDRDASLHSRIRKHHNLAVAGMPAFFRPGTDPVKLHSVRTHTSTENLPRPDLLAWKTAEMAFVPAPAEH